MSVHVKEHQMVEIPRVLHYGVPHNPIMVLGCKTPGIPILVILQNPQLDIFRAMHDDATACHLGFIRMLKQKRERFTGPEWGRQSITMSLVANSVSNISSAGEDEDVSWLSVACET